MLGGNRLVGFDRAAFLVFLIMVGILGWWKLILARCPACRESLPSSGMQGVWMLGKRLACRCGALLQEEGPVQRGPSIATWGRHRGLALYVLGTGLYAAAVLANEFEHRFPGPLHPSSLVAGCLLMSTGAAVHAMYRGRNPLWGLLFLAGPLSLPVLVAMGNPCDRCGRPRPWAWSRCDRCDHAG